MSLYPAIIRAQYVDLSDREQTLSTGKPNVLRIPDFDRIVIVKAKYGWVQALEPRSYVIYEPYRRLPVADTITVRSKTGVLLKQKVFKVVYSDCAHVQVGSLTSDTVTSADLLKADSLVITGGTAKHKVTSFSISYRRPHSDYQGPFAINTNSFGSFLRSSYHFMPPGTTIYIEHVKTNCSGCGEFIHPMSLSQKIFVK